MEAPDDGQSIVFFVILNLIFFYITFDVSYQFCKLYRWSINIIIVQEICNSKTLTDIK
jgi:hypothetical protein